jgi:hypothetical protein
VQKPIASAAESKRVAPQPAASAAESKRAAPQPPAPAPAPLPRHRAVRDEQPVVKTGSTDRHLVSQEEPLAPAPVSRPRSYRDLDAIPDDFD